MMVYIVKLHHDTETLLSSKTVPKLRGGLAIILLVVIMTAAQGQVISQQNAFHSNDCLTLLQISCPTLDHCGIDAVWDVSNMSVIDDSYSVEYLLASEDSEDIIACYEQATRHIYDQKGDSILINGFENRLTRLDYDIREPYLRFPMQYGDSLVGYYHGTGMYCDRLALRSYGRYKTKADGIGELILPDGDTLRNVIRLHTERLVAVEDYPAYMLDSLQPYKYNGKELDRMHGLDLYDYGFRQYDPVVPMFTQADPMAENYYHLSPYVYCGNNPVNAIDPDGNDGVRIIDDENKEIKIIATYYVVTESIPYKTSDGNKVMLEGFTDSDITNMNGLNDYLNGLNMEVSKGEYSGYKIHFSLNFVPAGSVLDATILASNAKCGNMNIGNTIRKGNEYTNRNLNFGTKGGPNGTTLTVGGVTSENRDIVMNSNTLYDTRMNRIHEIFHTLGFSHPKGSGGSQGIMTYPPSSPSKKDANELGNSTFLPMIKIK